MELIRVLKFKKSFDEKVVHEDVNFYVNKGTCVGLLGGSGEGKSVILRSIIGLEKPTAGEVFVLGQNIADWSDEQLVQIRTKVSYAFQGGALFDSMSVFENVAYPLFEHTQLTYKEVSKKVHSVLQELNLDESVHLYPAELSGGMQKRVGIARALVLNPDIILFDEPTAGLDPINTLKIQHIIMQLKKKGVTSMLVTHDMPTALAVCDDILLLSGGKIRARVRAEDIVRDPNHIVNRFMHGKAKPEELES